MSFSFRHVTQPRSFGVKASFAVTQGCVILIQTIQSLYFRIRQCLSRSKFGKYRAEFRPRVLCALFQITRNAARN